MIFWQVFQNDGEQMMKIKYQLFSGGRVGRSPYRDHNISKIISVIVGLDTPLTPALVGGAREEHSGLLDQRIIL